MKRKKPPPGMTVTVEMVISRGPVTNSITVVDIPPTLHGETKAATVRREKAMAEVAEAFMTAYGRVVLKNDRRRKRVQAKSP